MSNQSEKGPSFIKFRTVEYTVDDLSQYFHLPLTEAAKELGICCTALKKICRKNNISQWPYRRLSSLDRSIKQLEERCKKKRTNEKTEDYLRYLQTKRTTFIQSPAMKGTFNEWKRQRSPSSGSTITGIYDRKASHDSNNPDNGDVPEHIEELSHPSYHSNHSLPSLTLHNTIDNSEFYSTQQQHRMNGSVFENTSSSSSCHSDGEKDVHHSSAPLKHLPIVVENETYSSNLTSPSLLPSFHSLFSIPTTTSELNNSSSLNNNRLTQKISQNEVNLLSHFHQSTKNHKFDATTLDPKNGTLLNNFLHAAQLNNLPHQHLILMPNSPNFVPVESLPNQQSISGDINRTNHDKVLLREKEINGKSDDWPSKSANATSPSSPPSSSAPSLYHNSQASALVIHLDDKRNSNRSQSHNSSHHSNINNEKQVVDGLQMLLNISSLVNFDDNEKPSSSSSLPPPSFVSPLPALPSIHNINNYSVPTHLIFTSSGEPTSPSKLISNIPILSPSTTSPSPSPQSLNVISSNNANSNSTHNTAPVLNLQFQSWDPSMMNMKSKKAATPSLV